ncbi:NUDIX hydrolase [Kitasatospora sp. NPDC058063]|uniref:NUDIX hydrolase n=1 Tax=unclassified Kitasatospora TaxID=2633591 RepID=UPI0036DEF2DF
MGPHVLADAAGAGFAAPAFGEFVDDEQAAPVLVVRRGESLAGCGVRETREETGIEVEITGIVGTYTDPRHVFAYDDGEVRQEFSICLLGRPLGGELRVSDESHEVAWFTPAETDGLPMVANIRKRLADWRSGAIPVVRQCCDRDGPP